MKSDNFIVIQGWMINELNLKSNDLLVFALIYGFSRDGKTKFASGRKYIADSLNISLPTVDKSLQDLITLGYIVKEPCKNQADTDKYYANISSKETLLPKNISSKETLLPKNISSKETLLNKYIRDNTNQQELFTDNTNKEDTYNKKRENLAEKAQKFIDDFNAICKSLPKCQRLSPKRSKGISNILKKFSYEDILTVFEKLEASDFCSGRKTNWRADIDFILREDKFISVLEGKYDNQGRKCNVETISQGNKKQLSAEEREAIIKNGQKF